MLVCEGIQTRLEATRVECSKLDFSTVVTFINSLYSITGEFREWVLSENKSSLIEYKSEDGTASIISDGDRVVCCKFYKMLPSLVGLQVISPFRCKAIPEGIVIEK